MTRPFGYLAALLAVTFATACSGGGADGIAGPPLNAPAATATTLPRAFSTSAASAVLPVECTSVEAANAAIDALLPQLFKPGAGKRGTAQGYDNTIDKAAREGDAATAAQGIEQLINFTLSSYFSGDLIGGQSTDTQARVLKFIYLLYCANGLSPVPDLSGIFASANTVLIRPGTPDTVVRDDANNTKAALLVRTGDVPDDIFGTFVSVVPTLDPLPTELDWYGLTGLRSGAFEFIATPAVIFDAPVRTGVCVQYDDEIVQSPNDLRLAHGIDPANPPPPTPGNVIFGSIEILAPAPVDVLGLDCPPLATSVAQSRFGAVLDRVAALLLPQQLHASALLIATGGRGGDIRSLSPFAAVDTRLVATGSTAASPAYIPVGASSITTPATVRITTRASQAPISGIPVTFAPDAFAPASATTDPTGAATSTWTLVAGTNTGTGSPALSPFSFVGAPVSFSVEAIQVQPVVITAGQTPPAGVVGVAYGPFSFVATGGIGSFSWSVVDGALPNGLSLAANGTLSGTPTAAGAFTFTVRASSAPGAAATSGTAEFSISIAPPPVVVTTVALPAAQRGVAYSATLQATGGTGTYGWSLVAGTLPDGLSLTGDRIVGTPTATAVGTSFTVQATSGADSDTQALSLAVGAPSAIQLSFDPGPSGQVCYALNVVLAPTIAVAVRDQAGRPLAGVRVNLVSETNNGAPVEISQRFAVSDANGRAVFSTLSINKTGGYSLLASVTSPWPAATVRSGKFKISPSC